MDFSALLNTMLSGESVAGMENLTGASGTEVESVLSSVLPSLLSGAQGQAENEATAAGFAGALADHAKDDTSDLAAFLSNVDLADGGKIVAHLLGGAQQQATQQAADSAGLNFGQASSIISAAAPLLMSLLGKQDQQSQQQSSGLGALGSLFGGGGMDFGSLLGGLFGRK